MPAPFKCSECGFATNVKDEFLGKKIKCPKCKAVGVVGAAAKASKKGQEDSEPDLMSVKLDSFQDVEVPEGEYLDESQRPKAPKVKKRKKGATLDPQVKLAATAFSLISVLVVAGLIYFLGPVAKEKYDDYNKKAEASAEAKEKGGADAAPAAK